MQSTLVHLIPILKGRLPNFVLGLFFLVLGLSKLCGGGPGSWQPQRQRDEKSILRLPRNARRRQANLQMILAATLHILDALYKTHPAPSHNLMRGHPDALLLRHALTRDHVRHSDGLVGVLLGPTVATRLCTVLARLLTPALFFTVHSECWCASAPLAANLSANSFTANTHTRWLASSGSHSFAFWAPCFPSF